MWEVVDYFQRWWILMRMRWGSFPLDSYNLFPNFFIYILRKKINHPGRRGLGSAKRWYWHICGGREVIWKPLKKFVTKSKLSFLKVNYLKLKRLKKIPNKCKNLNQCGWRCICSAGAAYAAPSIFFERPEKLNFLQNYKKIVFSTST